MEGTYAHHYTTNARIKLCICSNEDGLREHYA